MLPSALHIFDRRARRLARFLAAASLLALAAQVQAITYNTPGAYSYTVPAGVTRVKVQVAGGGGGPGGWDTASVVADGGSGGRAHVISATLNVTAGQVITGTVAQGGRVGRNSSPTNVVGGAGGTGIGSGAAGGNAGASGNSGSGGGGGGGTTLALAGTVLLQAGGGGGGQGASQTINGVNGGNASAFTSVANCGNTGNGTAGANFTGTDGGGGGGGGGGYAGGSAGGAHADFATGGAASGAGTSCYSNNAAAFAATPTAALGTSASGSTQGVVGNGANGYVTIDPELSVTLTKAFGAASIDKGASTTLTFTLANPSGASAQTGLAFTDTLPSGLVLASAATSPQCGGTVTGAAGGTTIALSGGSLAAGASSCTITASVTSAAAQGAATCPAAATTNGAANVSGLSSNLTNGVTDQCLGITLPTRLTLQKALVATGRVNASDQFTVAIRTGGVSGTVVNSTAASTTTGSGATVTSGTGTTGAYAATAGTTYTLTEVGAGGTTLSNYAATLTCTDAAGVMSSGSLPANAAFNFATGHAITPVAGADLRCTITNGFRPRLTLQKVLGGGGRIDSSDQFRLSFTGTNAPAATNTTGSDIYVTSPPLFFTATAGSAYTLNEAMATGSASALSAYTQSVACSNAGGPTDVSDRTTLPISITPAPGDDIRCEITNTSPVPGGGGGGTEPAPVCNANPVIAGFNTAWTASGWDVQGGGVTATQALLYKNTGTATLQQSVSGVTPGALLTFTWQIQDAISGGVPAGKSANLSVSYNGTTYWTGTSVNGAGNGSSSASNGATCVSGCGSADLPPGAQRVIQLRLPASVASNGVLLYTATATGTSSADPADDIWLFAPVSIRNTGICLAKTSLGSTGTFNFTTSGVDTTMGGGGTTASVTTTAVNTARYYDASGTRDNNQPLLITSPGATANVTIGETPASGFVLESVNCPGLNPVRIGNSITIADVPQDTLTTCTFTNRTPIISLSKALGGNRFDAGDQFTVAIRAGGVNGTVVNATGPSTTTGSGSAIDAGTGTTGDFYTVPGTAYTLTETGTGGANLANYSATLTCTDSAGVTPAGSLPTNEAFDPAVGRAITPVTGANLRCVITNAPRPKISLQKAMGGAGRINASDQFVLSATGTGAPAAVTTTGSGINVTSAAYSFAATAGSAYTLNEAMAPGSASALSAYTPSVTCGNAGGPTNVSGITTLPISITAAAGDNISCVVTNYPTTDPGGGTSPDPGPTPVCNADPVLAGTNLSDGAWTRSGWSGVFTNSVGMSVDQGTATLSQTVSGVTPGAKLTFTWRFVNGISGGSPAGNSARLTVSYGGTVYWTANTPNGGGAAPASAASNGASCESGCATLAEGAQRQVTIRLPTGIPASGILEFKAQSFGGVSDDLVVYAPIAMTNTGICLAKTSLGSTGTFNFTTSGVDTTMGGGGTTASITTAAVNTARYYDASGTRTNNQPLLITSPGATANVTIGETPATGFVLESVSCPGLSPVRTGNSISIASVPRDTVTTCTFTNRAPIIHLSKALAGNRLGAADQFSVAIRTGGVNGTVVSSSAAATTTGSGSAIDAGTGTTGDFYTVPGTTYTLTESGAGGANIANYKASLTCSDAAGVTPAASLPTNESFNPAVGRAITPVTGANLRCVITNSPGAPTVSGRVFLDNGQGGGTANDGILNGGEGPLAGVTLRLTNCASTVHATVQSDAAGGYSLPVPASVASGAALCVEETNPGTRVSTGASVGATALPSGTATAVSGTSYTYTRTGTPDRIAFSWNGTGHANLNFGDVDNSTLVANGAKSGAPGNTVTYGHTFTAGTAGTVRFGIGTEAPTPAGATGWSAQIFADPACTGSLQPGAAQLYPPAGAGAAVAAAGTACIVVRQFIPATASQGASNRLTVKADFDYANAGPALAGSFTVEDTTTVSSSALDLRKEVRNVTQAGSFGVTNQAKSGETLEYRISYTNNSDQPISSMQISDTTPGYTTFVSATTGATPATLTSCSKNTPANAQPAAAVPCSDAQAAGGTGPIDWRFVGTIAPGGTGSVLFRVKVD